MATQEALEAALKEACDRILAMEAAQRAAAESAAKEREQLLTDFRTEISRVEGRIGAAPSAMPNRAAAGGPVLTANPENRLVDTRSLGRSDVFYGESNKWRDWAFQLKIYLMAVNSQFTQALERIEPSPVVMSNANLSPRSREMSTQMYYVLAMLSKARAQDKLRLVPQGEGFRAWHQFVSDYDPKVKTRRVGMLMEILTASFTGDLSQALDQFGS